MTVAVDEVVVLAEEEDGQMPVLARLPLGRQSNKVTFPHARTAILLTLGLSLLESYARLRPIPDALSSR